MQMELITTKPNGNKLITVRYFGIFVKFEIWVFLSIWWVTREGERVQQNHTILSISAKITLNWDSFVIYIEIETFAIPT